MKLRRLSTSFKGIHPGHVITVPDDVGKYWLSEDVDWEKVAEKFEEAVSKTETAPVVVTSVPDTEVVYESRMSRKGKK